MKVFVAMSGGVDSSVAAALLKEKGYKVTGVFFKPWAPFAEVSEGRSSPVFYCNWQQDRRDAMAVAEVLGIPFKTWDFSKEYKNKVGDYMIESYRRGITPNPDVMCNKEIKFGLFLKKALKEGADFIATGHYVRLKQATSYKLQVISQKTTAYSLQPIVYSLFMAKDKNKDQSYFLWTLTQEQLKHCLFPIGDYPKPEVRKLAKKFGLPTFNKKDSQGVCFIGQLDMKEFLKKYIPSKPGKIVLRDSEYFFYGLRGTSFSAKVGQSGGLPTEKNCTPSVPLSEVSSTMDKIIGTHEGAAYYTIGQRHGLNIANGGGPYYVSKKDLKKNLIFVTKDEKKLGQKEILIKDINWIDPKLIHIQGLTLDGLKIKIRYRAPAISVKVIHIQGLTLDGLKDGLKVRAAKPIRAVTPGQSMVFYRGQKMLGGGIII